MCAWHAYHMNIYISNCLTASPATVPGFEGLVAILAPSWGVWGPPWLQVGALGTILAPSWWSRGHLGSKLGGQEVILAPSWGIWGPSWLQVGSPPETLKLQLFESPPAPTFRKPPTVVSRLSSDSLLSRKNASNPEKPRDGSGFWGWVL